MVHYDYRLEKDGEFRMAGRTSNRKYIDNLIKYKRKSKRYKLEITKGILLGKKGSYRLINCETLFKN